MKRTSSPFVYVISLGSVMGLALGGISGCSNDSSPPGTTQGSAGSGAGGTGPRAKTELRGMSVVFVETRGSGATGGGANRCGGCGMLSACACARWTSKSSPRKSSARGLAYAGAFAADSDGC